MQLTKRNVLTIVKVLSHYNVKVAGHKQVADNVDVTEALLALEELLTTGCDHCLEKSTDHEVEQDDEVDDKGTSGDEEENEPDCVVPAEQLHFLKACKARVISSPDSSEVNRDVTIEFEENDDDCDLLIDESPRGTITQIRRFTNELHVLGSFSKVQWYVFSVTKFPKGWLELLPLNALIKVDE